MERAPGTKTAVAEVTAAMEGNHGIATAVAGTKAGTKAGTGTGTKAGSTPEARTATGRRATPRSTTEHNHGS